MRSRQVTVAVVSLLLPLAVALLGRLGCDGDNDYDCVFGILFLAPVAGLLVAPLAGWWLSSGAGKDRDAFLATSLARDALRATSLVVLPMTLGVSLLFYVEPLPRDPSNALFGLVVCGAGYAFGFPAAFLGAAIRRPHSDARDS